MQGFITQETCSNCNSIDYVRKRDSNKLCNSCIKIGRPTSKLVRKLRSERMQGEKHWNWKGGNRKATHDYILVYRPSHPFSNSIGMVYEHRLVAEENLGRYLYQNEEVHHIDKNRQNNEWQNLFVCSGKMHRKIHHCWYNT